MFARWMGFGALFPFARGHTGKGNYGHGLDRVWLDIPSCQLVAVAACLCPLAAALARCCPLLPAAPSSGGVVNTVVLG